VVFVELYEANAYTVPELARYCCVLAANQFVTEFQASVTEVVTEDVVFVWAVAAVIKSVPTKVFIIRKNY
jgi:hypothetical protein